MAYLEAAPRLRRQDAVVGGALCSTLTALFGIADLCVVWLALVGTDCFCHWRQAVASGGPRRYVAHHRYRARQHTRLDEIPGRFSREWTAVLTPSDATMETSR